MHVSVTDQRLVIGDRRGRRYQIASDEVRRAEIYKRDDLTTDLICCDLTVERNGVSLVYTLHEEAPGWGEFLAWLGLLPGFRADWRSAVVLPPFEANRTVVFEAPTRTY
jgi:hypothetical protein